jgi:ankyrin repeat protein
MHSFFSRLSHSPIPHRTAVTLVTLIVLAWSSLAFCGEIHDAARAGDLAKVKALLNDNPKLVFSKDDNGTTPLHLAAHEGRKDVAELLLAKKADVNAQNNNGTAPLHWAAIYDHKDVAELLLANKADIDAKDSYGDTPLHYAALWGYMDMVELLLDNKADVNAKDKYGDTPWHEAALKGHKDVVELLRQHGGQE